MTTASLRLLRSSSLVRPSCNFSRWCDRTTGSSIRTHFSYESPGSYHSHDHDGRTDLDQRGYTVGIGGPVGSGKTALVLALCRTMTNPPITGVVTNDIFTQEDAEFLVRHNALDAPFIRAVETGGCPHAAIREDVSANLAALEQLTSLYSSSSKPQQSKPCLLLCESGGDNLAANFSKELADLTLYVIDVAGGDKVPRKGGPGITQSDLLIINKVDLADAVGADLDVMARDAKKMRGEGPVIFASVKHGKGVPEIVELITNHFQSALHHHHHHHHHHHEHEGDAVNEKIENKPT